MSIQQAGMKQFPCLITHASHPDQEFFGWAGKLPSFVDFIAICKAKSKEKPFGEVLMVAQSQPAESLLMGKPHITNGNAQQVMEATNGASRKWINLLNKRAEEMPFNYFWEHRRHRDLKVEKSAEVGVSTGGGTAALNMLHAYLKALEPSRNPQEGSVVARNSLDDACFHVSG